MNYQAKLLKILAIKEKQKKKDKDEDEDKKEGKKEDIKKDEKGDMKEGMKEDMKDEKKDEKKEDMKEDMKEGMKQGMKEGMKEDMKEGKKQDKKEGKKQDKKKDEKEYFKLLRAKKFLNSLIYGASLTYCLSETNPKLTRPMTLFMQDSNPEILIAIDKQTGKKIRMFDLNKFRVRRNLPKYEVIYGFDPKEYLVIEDYDQILTLYFKVSQKRTEFFESCNQFLDVIRQSEMQIDSSLLKNFLLADVNENNLLDLKQVSKVFQKMRNKDTEQIQKLTNYIKESASRRGSITQITLREFQNIGKILNCRAELIPVFQQFSGFKLLSMEFYFTPALLMHDFNKFLKDRQGQDEASANKICQQVYKSNKGMIQRISFYEFSRYIWSKDNTITDPNYANSPVSLQHSILDYYCYSSHRNYLTNNNLVMMEITESYYEDLVAGVRCLEIFCHDSIEGPVVRSGYKFVKDVKLKQIVDVIVKFSKDNPQHTPIVLEIDYNCSEENMDKIFDILNDGLGEKLAVCDQGRLESLKDLLGKVVLKSYGEKDAQVEKNYYGFKKKVEMKKLDYHPPSSFSQKRRKFYEQQKKNNQKTQKFADVSEQIYRFFITNSENFKSFESKIINLKKQSRSTSAQQKKLSIINQNADLLFQQPKRRSSFLCINLNDEELNNALKEDRFKTQDNEKKEIQKEKKSGTIKNLIQASKKYFIRVHPKIQRINNYNYNPLQAFEIGAQIVAINTLFTDHPSLVTRMFFEKGSKTCKGYRSKPASLRGIQKPQSKQIEWVKKVSITPQAAHKVYYNSMSKKDKIPPCQVQMRLYCHSSDENKQYMKFHPFTEQIKNNSLNPVFEEKKAISITIKQEQLAFVVAEIKQCGVAVIPIESIRSGYRHVTLYDDNSMEKQSKILFLVKVLRVKVKPSEEKK